MAVQSLTIKSLKMFNQHGAQITFGLPHKIEIVADIKTEAIAEGIYGSIRAYLQTRLNDENGIVIQSGGDATNHAGNVTAGYYTQGTVESFNNLKNIVTAKFEILNFARSVFQSITEGYNFNNNTDINKYIASLSKADKSAAYTYSKFRFNILVCNNAVTHTGALTKDVPSDNNIYVPNTSEQFTAPEELRIAIKDSLKLSASNDSSNLIYSPVISNYAIVNYKQRTDCLVGTCLERNDGTNIKIAWKNNSRIIFSKTFYDYLTILRRPGAIVDIDKNSYYISHSFPLTKLKINLTCVKGTSKEYKKTFIIDQTELTWDSTNKNYYYPLTDSTVFDYTAFNDDENYLTKQGQTLNFKVDIDLLDINERPDTWSSYWGSGILNLVITNPDVPTKIRYYGTTESSLSMLKETADNNILYYDQKANSYTINIPATETNERYIIYNYKISFYIKSNNRKIELWRGYGLPDTKNTSSLPTAMQSSNINNVVKSNNLFSVTFTKEKLNNKILNALGGLNYYNGLDGNELWEGYFIIESVLGNDYDTIDKNTDIKVVTSKQIGELLLSNSRTKIDSNTLKLTVTKYKLDSNNKKIETSVSYDFNTNYDKDTIENAKEDDVGYINSGEKATFETFGFIHYKDVTYTNLKLTIQDFSYKDAPINSRKWELEFNSNSNLIRNLNSNSSFVEIGNLKYSKYLYDINHSYLSNLTYNNSFYYVVAGSIFTVETTFTYKGKTYTEIQPTKRYKKIVFCNVDRNRFTSSVELKQYVVKNDAKNSIEVQFSEDFLDIGGALGYAQPEPYNNWYQNFYFNGNNGKIEKTITAYFKEDNKWTSLLIGDANVESKIEYPFNFNEIMNSIPSEPKTHTITLSKNNLEKIFGEVKILITYSLNDGAYYSDFAVGSTISNNLRIKTREIYFNTAAPTIYKRPFSVGINQFPGDEEILRINIPDADSLKKYIALGELLLINLETGDFLKRSGEVVASSNGRFVKKGDEYIPYREKLHSGQQRYDYTWTKIL